MSWRDYLSSPPPDTVWHLDERMAMVVHRDRKRGDRCAAADLPDDLVEMGTVGIQAFDSDRSIAVLPRLHKEVEGSRRAAVIIPTAWVRTLLVDVDDLPRREKDLDEVRRWRLRKLLSVPPADLRLAASVQPAHGGKQQVLCTVVLDKVMARLEAAFAAVGVVPGLIVPRILALSMEPNETAPLRLFVQHEASLLSVLLIAEGGIRLVRTKLLPSVSGSWDGVEREISMAVTYVRTQLGFGGPVDAVVSALDGEASARLTSFLGAQGDFEVREAAAGRLFGDPGFADRLGHFRVAPVAAVLRGGSP